MHGPIMAGNQESPGVPHQPPRRPREKNKWSVFPHTQRNLSTLTFTTTFKATVQIYQILDHQLPHQPNPQPPETMSHASSEHDLEKGPHLEKVGTVVLTPEMFEKLYLQPQTRVTGNLRTTFGNPTPVSVLYFSCVWSGPDVLTPSVHTVR